MIQSIPKTVTFDEFIAWYPEGSGYHYELRNGEIVEMPKPTGKHSRVAGFITVKAGIEIERLKLPYFIPKECVIKSIHDQSGYESDVIILDERTIADSPRWEKESIITQGSSVRLVVEVVSSNDKQSRDRDYVDKRKEYAERGIPEYWLIDPERSLITVLELENDRYQEVGEFKDTDTIVSPTFSNLQLTAELGVFYAGVLVAVP